MQVFRRLFLSDHTKFSFSSLPFKCPLPLQKYSVQFGSSVIFQAWSQYFFAFSKPSAVIRNKTTNFIVD
ncbi:hypothetical protein HMPREF3156_00535 [Neisseria sp. HMSC06F02]|nr:hypothetical protein HMPREF3156_00535 [Neisseria sp. HMSC06F02]